MLTLLWLFTQTQSLPGTGTAWGTEADSQEPRNSGGELNI